LANWHWHVVDVTAFAVREEPAMDGRLTAYSLLTVIQDRVASALARDGAPATELEVVGRPLLDQLRDRDVQTPDALRFGLATLLDVVQVVDELGERDSGDLFGRLRSRFGAPLKGIDLDRVTSLRDLAQNIRALGRNLLQTGGQAQGAAGPGPLDGLLGGHLALAISFVTTLRNLARPDLADEIPRGWKDYFFSDDGFKTVDQMTILPPEHGRLETGQPGQPSSGLAGLQGLKGILKERSGERYVRDLIRITVEVAGDARYKLRERYPLMLKEVESNDNQAKAERWFRGAGSMAESLVTSAVEEALLGVAQFQTNALIAASAATYAGTAVRKATQHAFLAKVGV
jgi:hypothetical protein